MSEATENNSQHWFFEQMRQQIPKHISLVNILMTELKLSKDAAYRRINGSCQLSFNDALLLAKKFNIRFNSSDDLKNEFILFQRKNAVKTHSDVKRNMTQLHELLKQQNTVTNSKIIYSTKDIPPFYQFAYPDLAAFKIYSWINAVDNDLEKDRSFRPSEINDEFADLSKKLVDEFSKIESTEIWSETTVLNFIRQLEYYYEAKLIKNRNVALDVCEQYRDLFRFLEKQALANCKLHPNYPYTKTVIPYALYFNEMLIMENSILAYQGVKKIFFQTFAYFNFHSTNDEDHCNNLEVWLNSQIANSIELSSTREKERNQFFSKIDTQIGALMDRIVTNTS